MDDFTATTATCINTLFIVVSMPCDQEFRYSFCLISAWKPEDNENFIFLTRTNGQLDSSNRLYTIEN